MYLQLSGGKLNNNVNTNLISNANILLCGDSLI